MKRALLPFLVAIPGIATAQAMYNPQPTMNMPNYSTEALSAGSFGQGQSSETPAMQRRKLAHALALREEAAKLLAADGGTFTPEHRAYIERKRDSILAR